MQKSEAIRFRSFEDLNAYLKGSTRGKKPTPPAMLISATITFNDKTSKIKAKRMFYYKDKRKAAVPFSIVNKYVKLVEPDKMQVTGLYAIRKAICPLMV